MSTEQTTPFLPGALVMLNSGGACMTVESCEWRQAQSGWFVLCWWLTTAGELRSCHIPACVLQPPLFGPIIMAGPGYDAWMSGAK